MFEKSTHLIKAMGASVGLALLVGLSGLFFGTSAGYGFGLSEPFVAKTHPNVDLLTVSSSFSDSIYKRRIDLPSIRAAESIDVAGSHPDGSTSFRLEPGSITRDVIIDLPPGFNGNPEVATICSREDLAFNACAPSSQVGVAMVDLDGVSTFSTPVYRVVRAGGSPATFAFNLSKSSGSSTGFAVLFNPRVRSESDYGISIGGFDIVEAPYELLGVTVTLWGVPAASIHDPARWNPVAENWGASAGIEEEPFLTVPPRCNLTDDLATNISLRSWTSTAVWLPRDLPPGGSPADYTALSPKPLGCQSMPDFEADLEMGPALPRAGAPAGYVAKLKMPYDDLPGGQAMAHLKKVEVALPAGVTISPAAANGLMACSDDQAGFGTRSGSACPDASKIGQLSVKTPLLPEPLKGEVFIGAPTQDQLLRVFIVLEGYGVTARIAGDVDTDPVTGQVRAVFDNNPQLPFTEMDLRFFPGALASLVNPEKCGTYTTETTFTSWNDDVHVSRTPLVINQGCISTKPFRPWLDASTSNPLSGEYSEFLTRFGRDDADEQMDSITVELPMGLAAKIAGVPRCAADKADAGTCGPESRVGHVQAAAGAGPQPFWVPGPGSDPTSVSLAGPYRGAPFSLSIVVPAQAGPFDLGRVVVRAPISIDMRTAQVSVDVIESRWYDRFGKLAKIYPGKIPTILEGIPLRLKEERVIIDREEFMVNPTGCDVKQVKARIGAVDGRVADLSSPFRATDCADLGFNPRFNMRILDKGRRSTRRSWNPRTRFVLRPRAGDANMGPTVVTLPSSVILDQSNIKTLCTRAQFAERRCPERAIYGYAKAWSPLLDEPVEGPVYMQANGGVRPLPDILADLDGQVRVGLEGWIDTVRRGGKGRLRNRFMVVPDVPVTRFELTMNGGRNRGLLVNSTDLCRTRERGVARFRGANGKLSVQRPAIQMAFKGCKKVRRAAARKAAARKKAKRAKAGSVTNRPRARG